MTRAGDSREAGGSETDERSATGLELAAPRSRPRLAWTDASGDHEVELLERRTCGSAVHCELVIADRAVSRLHFELDPLEDGLWVRDLGSRNGTYVSGVEITEARVPPGAAIRVGTTDLTVAYSIPQPPEGLWPQPFFGGLVARSAAMREVFAAVAAIAATDASVVIEGEPGTGKKAVARALHEASTRSGEPFVVVECGALLEPSAAADTLEQALEGAVGGTLVLDEPSELSLAVQRELTPRIDAKTFRVVVTTQKDLRRLVNQGVFRESLYFRLAKSAVRLPPLREHIADLAPLLERFLGDRAGLVSRQLVANLERLPWPGNVRELRRYAERVRTGDVERAVAAAALDAVDYDGRRIPTAEEFRTTEVPSLQTLLARQAAQAEGHAVTEPPPAAAPEQTIPAGFEPWFSIGFKEFRERWIEVGEREYLRRLMVRTKRSSGTAAREAGLERTYLYRLLKKHGV